MLVITAPAQVKATATAIATAIDQIFAALLSPVLA